MNNQVLHLANQGVTINQIHNVYELPKGLQQQWYTRGYHGSPRAQQPRRRPALSRLLGLQPGDLDSAFAGELGAPVRGNDGRRGKIMARGRELHDAGQVPARPGDPEQAGAGRAENQRPRTCSPTSSSRSATSRRTRACATASSPPLTSCARAFPRARPSVRAALTSSAPCPPSCSSTSSGFAWTAARRRACASRSTWSRRTTARSSSIELENATLTNIQGFLADAPDLTLTINRADLEQTMMGAKTLDAQIADGTAKVEGDAGSSSNSPRPWSSSIRASRSCPVPSRRPKSWRRSIPTRRVRSSPLRSSLPAPPTSRARPSPSSADSIHVRACFPTSAWKRPTRIVGRAPCHAASRLPRSRTGLTACHISAILPAPHRILGGETR